MLESLNAKCFWTNLFSSLLPSACFCHFSLCVSSLHLKIYKTSAWTIFLEKRFLPQLSKHLVIFCRGVSTLPLLGFPLFLKIPHPPILPANRSSQVFLINRNATVKWYCGAVVITTAQLHSTKPELKFCAGSNPACRVSDINNGEDLW